MDTRAMPRRGRFNMGFTDRANYYNTRWKS